MKKGKLEGIIFSLKDKGGDKICKWKGPQEYQPSIHKRFLDANDTIIQPSNSVDEKVKSIFKIIADVILDISQNKAITAARAVTAIITSAARLAHTAHKGLGRHGQCLSNWL